jgi:hypothetical protein
MTATSAVQAQMHTVSPSLSPFLSPYLSFPSPPPSPLPPPPPSHLAPSPCPPSLSLPPLFLLPLLLPLPLPNCFFPLLASINLSFMHLPYIYHHPLSICYLFEDRAGGRMQPHSALQQLQDPSRHHHMIEPVAYRQLLQEAKRSRHQCRVSHVPAQDLRAKI